MTPKWVIVQGGALMAKKQISCLEGSLAGVTRCHECGRLLFGGPGLLESYSGSSAQMRQGWFLCDECLHGNFQFLVVVDVPGTGCLDHEPLIDDVNIILVHMDHHGDCGHGKLLLRDRAALERIHRISGVKTEIYRTSACTIISTDIEIDWDSPGQSSAIPYEEGMSE